MAFQQNVHNFRAFAIIGVVAAHCLHNFNWQNSEKSLIVLDVIFNQSTIWFAFIAGYLFQRLSTNYTTGRYYRKKIANVNLYLHCFTLSDLHRQTLITVLDASTFTNLVGATWTRRPHCLYRSKRIPRTDIESSLPPISLHARNVYISTFRPSYVPYIKISSRFNASDEHFISP